MSDHVNLSDSYFSLGLQLMVIFLSINLLIIFTIDRFVYKMWEKYNSAKAKDIHFTVT